MCGQTLAYGRGRRAGLDLREVGVHAGWRRRDRQTKNVVQQPFAAQHRGRPIRVRRGREQRSLAEQPAALVEVRKRHATEAAAVDAGNAVMPRQPFVDKRVVGVEEFHDAAILADRAADKQFRFPLEGLQQVEVVVGIPILIDHDFLDAAQIQPLRGEVVDERIGGARVRQHSPHFSNKDRRVRQLTALGQREQAIVGDAAPEKERQARGEFDAVEPIRRLRRLKGRLPVDAQQEVRVDEHAFERELNSGIKRPRLRIASSSNRRGGPRRRTRRAFARHGSSPAADTRAGRPVKGSSSHTPALQPEAWADRRKSRDGLACPSPVQPSCKGHRSGPSPRSQDSCTRCRP